MSVKGKKAKPIAGGISKIQELVDKEKNAKIRDRYRAILWSNQGMSQTQISKNLNKTRETIRSWIKKWNKDESLEDRERSGRPAILSREEENQVVEYVKERKYAGRITCKNICNWVHNKFNKQISKESIRNILKEARLSWKKPGKVDYRRNEAERAEFIEFLKKRKGKKKGYSILVFR